MGTLVSILTARVSAWVSLTTLPPHPVNVPRHAIARANWRGSELAIRADWCLKRRDFMGEQSSQTSRNGFISRRIFFSGLDKTSSKSQGGQPKAVLAGEQNNLVSGFLQHKGRAKLPR